MAKVFISHSSSDRTFVERELIPALQAAGIETWYSPLSIQSAEQWERSIRRGLESCDWFLLALSPRSASSEWVRTELFWAFKKRQGRIIPVFLETCDPIDLHLMLFELQFVDFRKDPEDGRRKLIATFQLSSDVPSAERQQLSQTTSAPSQTPPAPEEARNLYDAAQAFFAWKEYERAIAKASDAIQIHPTYENAFMLRGIAFSHKQNYERAIADFTQVTQLNPKNAIAFEQRGLVYQQKGDLEISLDDLHRAIQLSPTGNKFTIRGLTYNLKADYVNAIADFTKAIEEDPRNQLAIKKRAVAYWRLSRDDESISDATKAITLRPADGESYGIRAMAYHRKGQNNQAITDADESVRLSPNDAQLRVNRGHIHRAMGHVNEARNDFEHAVRLNPDFAKRLPAAHGDVNRIDEAFGFVQVIGHFD